MSFAGKVNFFLRRRVKAITNHGHCLRRQIPNGGRRHGPRLRQYNKPIHAYDSIKMSPNTNSSGSSSSSSSIPVDAWDPILEHYVLYWFGRKLHETIYDELNAIDVTPLFEAVLNGDEGSVFMLLLFQDSMMRRRKASSSTSVSVSVEAAATALTAGRRQRKSQYKNNDNDDNSAEDDHDHDDSNHHRRCDDILREVDVNGWTPLHYAIWKRNETIVRLLLDNDRRRMHTTTRLNDSHFTTTTNDSATSTSVDDENDASSCSSFLINVPKNDGETPLHVATDIGDESMVRVLLKEYGDIIDVNFGDLLLHTPLHLAIKRRHYNIANLLLNVGNANPNVQTLIRKKTPLHFVTFHDNKMMRLLLQQRNPIDIAAQDSDGNTWLHLMLKNNPIWYTQDDIDTISDILLMTEKENEDDGLNSILFLRNNMGQTPLDLIGMYYDDNSNDDYRKYNNGYVATTKPNNGKSSNNSRDLTTATSHRIHQVWNLLTKHGG